MNPKNFSARRLREQELAAMARVVENYAHYAYPELNKLRMRIDARDQGANTVFTLLAEWNGNFHQQHYTEDRFLRIQPREEVWRWIIEEFLHECVNTVSSRMDEHIVDLLSLLL